jgi:hypothetical protein
MDEIRPEPIEQIRRRHEGEWLLIKVTSHDENGLPKEGVLLFHSPDREAVYEAVDAAFKRGENELLTCFAGPLVPEGWEVVLNVLDEV